MSTAEGWSETIPVNISVAPEDANVSEDLLEDDNESTELDGNLSDAKLASVRLKTKCYPRRHRVGSAGLRREACWEGMVSEVPKIEHELIGEFIRHSRTEDNASEVSNSSSLDHSGQLQPRVSMRAAFSYANLAAEAPVGLCWKMSVMSSCKEEWGDCGVRLRVDPCSYDVRRCLHSR